MAKRSPLVIIFVTVFLDLVGFGIVIPVLPLYAERFGASPLVIGLLLGIYSAMQAICAPLLGKLSDRVGRRPVLLASIIGTAIGFFLMGCAKTLWLLFVARIIDGVTGGNLSTAQAYIADVTPPEHRSKGMGLIGAAFGLGFIFGPAIGGIMSRISLAAPFFFAAGLAAMNALALFFLLPESLPPREQRHARPNPADANESQRVMGGHAPREAAVTAVFHEGHGWTLAVILATYFFATVAFSLLTATYPLFTERRFGYDARHNGYIFAGQGVLGAVIQGALMGRLVRAFRERWLVIAGIALLALGLFTLPVSASVAALLLATAIVAIGHSLLMAPLNGLASKNVDAASQGRVLGLMQSSASMARIVGPVLGGWLLNMDVLHHVTQFAKTPYWTGGAIMLLALLIASTLQ